MKISVIFINGTKGSVRVEDLDELLEKKVIVGFQRSSGWALVGMAPMRSIRGEESGSWRDRKTRKLLMNN